ncbi:hypothetical protein ACFXOS_28265 [Streptomyces sp. NPDC059175]|uniref:hypothetical protein n=1 Tax=Streptomyces sp. NPDC059175 TaxID=3346757 RepID=UPI003691353A
MGRQEHHPPEGRRPGLPGSPADLTGANPVGSDSIDVDGRTARGSLRNETPAAICAAMTVMGEPSPDRVLARCSAHASRAS